MAYSKQEIAKALDRLLIAKRTRDAAQGELAHAKHQFSEACEHVHRVLGFNTPVIYKDCVIELSEDSNDVYIVEACNPFLVAEKED